MLPNNAWNGENMTVLDMAQQRWVSTAVRKTNMYM